MVLRGGGLSLLSREPAPGFFCLPGEVVGRAGIYFKKLYFQAASILIFNELMKYWKLGDWLFARSR